MDWESLLVDVDDGVATITLNRPEHANAVNTVLGRELPDAMWDADADESVRAIVVTGAGNAFCAGADVSDPDGLSPAALAAHGFTGADDSANEAFERRYAFQRMRTPVIGAINGIAVGGGLTLALLFDVRVVADDARLGFVFTRLGVTPEGGSTWLLPRIVGASRAAELLLTGRSFTGAEAAAMGLATAAVPRAEVLPRAQAIAAEIATHTAPHAVAATKHLLYAHLAEADWSHAFAREMRFVGWAASQPDLGEALLARLDRRPAHFTGSKHVPLPG